RERLGEISQRFCLESGLLCVQAQMIGISKHAFEQQTRLIEPLGSGVTSARERFDQPEGAHVESAFFAGKSVHARSRRIAVHETVAHQSTFTRTGKYRFDGANHARIGWGHEKYQWHDQDRRIEVVAT